VSATGGDSLAGSLGKERKRSSRTVIFAVIIVAVLVLGAVVWLTVQSGNNINNRVPYSYAHIPISITGNAGFTTANGVLAGKGTASDPYIIADWDIYAEGAHGISISHTDAHFIVRNCSVHDTLHNIATYDGIYLSACINGTLENNICSRDFCGIFLSSSRNNTLVNNDCRSNLQNGICLNSSSGNTLSKNTCDSIYRGERSGDGIYLVSSWNNILSANTCIGDGNNGIYLVSSCNNTLSNNTCTNDQYGIVLGSSSNNNKLSNDNCSSNIQDGIELSASNNNTLNKNRCSSNLGEGIWLTSSTNNTLSNNTCFYDNAGVDLWESSNNWLVNNNCSSDNIGVRVISSDNNTIGQNNCSSNHQFGICFEPSDKNNEVFWNLLCNNVGYGVAVSGSNNRIWYNIIIGNNGATSTYNASHEQARDDGTNNWWNGTDFLGNHGNYWSDWTTPSAVTPGIVDHPYIIPGNAGAKDYYPLSNDPRYIQVETLS